MDPPIPAQGFPGSLYIAKELSVGLAAPDQTLPYGTAIWRDAFPGTSCLATIILSLRDKRHSTAQAAARVSV
jgi:hypothetical protein